MNLQKFRWSRVYESSEEELVMLLRARNIKSKRVVAHAGSAPTEQHSDRSITIWCGEGSLEVRTDSTSISLQPGDGIRIDTDTAYSLHPGIAGYTCYLTK